MRTSFIVNPAAGRGKTARIWPLLADILTKRDFPHEVYFTSGPGEATSLARDLSTVSDLLVVAGGDGTIHEAVQGLALQAKPLVILPTGTGNDLARTMGIPRNPQQALESIFAGHIKKIDLGLVNGRYFINVAGVGFDAEVALAVNTKYSHIPGTGAYLLALLQQLANYRNVPVRLEVDGLVYEQKALLVAVGNGCYLGGGMKIVPQAKIDDGYFHVCLVGDVTKMETLQTLPKIFNGRHIDHPKVQVLKGQAIKIDSRDRMVLHADGEIIGHAPAEFTLLPQVLPLLVPG